MSDISVTTELKFKLSRLEASILRGAAVDRWSDFAPTFTGNGCGPVPCLAGTGRDELNEVETAYKIALGNVIKKLDEQICGGGASGC